MNFKRCNYPADELFFTKPTCRSVENILLFRFCEACGSTLNSTRTQKSRICSARFRYVVHRTDKDNKRGRDVLSTRFSSGKKQRLKTSALRNFSADAILYRYEIIDICSGTYRRRFFELQNVSIIYSNVFISNIFHPCIVDGTSTSGFYIL